MSDRGELEPVRKPGEDVRLWLRRVIAWRQANPSPPPGPEELAEDEDRSRRTWADMRAALDVLHRGPRSSEDVQRLQRLCHAPMVRCSHDPGVAGRWLHAAPRLLAAGRPRARGAGRPARRAAARSSSRSGDSGSDDPEPGPSSRLTRSRRPLVERGA